jgi:hypothetical protein
MRKPRKVAMPKVSSPTQQGKSHEIQEWLAANVVGTVSYVDSIWLFTHRPLVGVCTEKKLNYVDAPWFLKYYLPPSTHRQIEQAARGRSIAVIPCRSRGQVVGCKLAMHQPSPTILHLLDQLQQCLRLILCGADIAVDWLTCDQDHATWLKVWLCNHASLPWSRPGAMLDTGLDLDDESKPTYLVNNKQRRDQGKRPAARNLAIYADKPCKLFPAPCAHAELRLRNAACRRRGWHKPSDLIGLNPNQQYAQHLRFIAFDGERYLQHVTRQEVAKERRQHLATRHQRKNDVERRFEERHRSTLPGMLRSIYQRGRLLRAQVLKFTAPKWMRNSIPIEVLGIPQTLTWQGAEGAGGDDSTISGTPVRNNPMISRPPFPAFPPQTTRTRPPILTTADAAPHHLLTQHLTTC